jgi:lysozyme
MNIENQNLQYDRTGLDLTEHSEADGGPVLKSYWDETGKVWTAGFGHTRGVTKDTVCTPELAEAWLQEDIQVAVKAVKFWVDIPLSQKQFDALVDFTFNAGEGNLSHSTMLLLINASNFLAALGEFQKWDKSGGRVLPGLRSRRRAEAILFALGTDFNKQNPNT